MDKQTILKMAEDAGFSWLTTKDDGDQFVKFAEILAQAERYIIAEKLRDHLASPQAAVNAKIADSERKVVIEECISIVEQGFIG